MSEAPIEKSFNPDPHLMKIGYGDKAQDYLAVKWRLVWFRAHFPNGEITTRLLHFDPDVVIEKEVDVWDDKLRKRVKKMVQAKGRAMFHATVKNGVGGVAEGIKMEDGVDFPDYSEKAETGAIGRALAGLGYGTQFTGDELKEGVRIVDSPVSTDQPPAAQQPKTKQAPAAPAASTPTPKKEINPEHQVLLAAFKGMVSEEELQDFVAATGIKEKKWGGDEFKQAADLLASYPIPVSLQSGIRRMMDVYGERVTRECCSTLFPEIAGKLFSEMPVTTALKFLQVGQKDARFYHEMVSIYDPEQKTVKVTLQIDSILQLFYQPELQEKRKWLYNHLVKSVRQSPQALGKLSDEFCELFAVELADIKKLAQTAVIPKKEAA